MMLPTHVVTGLALATPLVFFHPEFASAALFWAAVGSIFPDIDLYWGHRRTLHYPTGYSLVAVPAAGMAFLFSTPATVGGAFFVVGAAVHCQMDRLGGGLELKPWKETSERAVYDHVRGRWRRPKRLIRYDGSPGDFLLLATLSLPLFVVLDGPFQLLAALALLVGGLYAALRRRLAQIAPVVFGYVPAWLEAYVPDRYRE